MTPAFHQREFKWAWRGGLAVATYFAVFRLPFLFPPTYRTLSASYSAGFSNRAATIAAALLALVSFVVAWTLDRPAAVEETQRLRMPRALLWSAWIGYLAFYGLLAASIYRNVRYYALDNAWFLEGLGQMDSYGRIPYRDFSFAYGPLMLYLPLTIKRLAAPLHLTLQASYDLVLIAMALAGVWMVFRLMDDLVADRKFKQVVFVVLALAGLNVCMVMSYTFFRFATPYYALLCADRMAGRGRSALFMLAAGAMVMGTSPEVGISFACGASVYYLLRTWREGWKWLAPAAAAWCGVALVVAACDPAFLRGMLSAMAAGFFALVIVPAPHLVLFLMALVFIVPTGMARIVKSRHSRPALLVAFCAISICMLPSALGRADYFHVFFSGLGVLLLSFVFAAGYPEGRRLAWTVAVAVVFLYGNLCLTLGHVPQIASGTERDLSLFLPQPEAHSAVEKFLSAVPLLKLAAGDEWGMSHDADAIAISELAAVPGSGGIATPFHTDWKTDEALKAAGRYVPERYWGFVALPDAQAEQSKVGEMDRHEWALIPIRPEAYRYSRGMEELIFMFPVSYVEKRECYRPGELLLSHLDTQWERVRRMGRYWLYHKRPLLSGEPTQ